MLQALIESAGRFPDLPPDGYERGEIRWVIEVESDGSGGTLLQFDKGQLEKMLPTRGDRSGKVSGKNLKAALLVDRASYALGLRSDRTLDGACPEHLGFRTLVAGLSEEGDDPELFCILAFLGRLHDAPSDRMRTLRKEITSRVKVNDMVAFRSQASSFPFELPARDRFGEGNWWLIARTARPIAVAAECLVRFLGFCPSRFRLP